MADYDGGLRVIDVSNPASPVVVGFSGELLGFLPKDVAVANDLIYVACSGGGMSILRFTGSEQLYGDVSGDGNITAFDASLILQVVVGILQLNDPSYPNLTLERADVTGNGMVSALDAALVLQYIVGLITEFPVDRLTSPSDVTPQNYELTLPNLTAKAGERIYVPLQLNQVSGLFAGGITIKYDANVLRAVKVRASLNSAYYESNIPSPGEIRFAFATTNPLNDVRELMMVEFEVMPDTQGITSPLLIVDAQLSESLSIARHNGLIEVLPAKTALLPNYPNPFNPETWIPYQLSAESDAAVEVYDIHGRLVRGFELGMQPAGSYVTKDRAVYWNGKNEVGERVASGVYFYRLKAVSPSPSLSLQGRGDYTAGTFSAMRRFVMVK